MTIDTTRRRFIQGGAALGLGTVPGMSFIRSANAAASPTTVVHISLDGGNDTLNTVIPYANPEYYRLRNSLAIAKDKALPIDAANALHPELTGLKALWDRGRVAIVHGVGYPNFDYSHFLAKQIYTTAEPGRTWRTGWLGRAVDAMAATNPNIDVLTGMAIGEASTGFLLGQRFVAVQSPNNTQQFWLGSSGAPQSAALTQLMQLPATTTNPVRNRLLQSSQTAFRAYSKIKATDNIVASSAYPVETFALNLRMAVQLMRTDPDIRVICVSQGGYDHHVDLIGNHAANLRTLNAALTAFTDDLDRTGLSGRVLIMIQSEFSRRVIPNAQYGLDHGAAQAMILIGPGVRAGIVGTAPLLTQASMINNGNLPMQYDFRSLYTTVLGGWLGIDPRLAMGGLSFPTLPVLL